VTPIGHVLIRHAGDYAANRGLLLVFGYLADNPRIPPHRSGSRRPDRRDTLASRDRAGAAQRLHPRPDRLDDFGLYVADIMAQWKSTLLAPLGEPAPSAPLGAD
jgi:hypothetical protein